MEFSNTDKPAIDSGSILFFIFKWRKALAYIILAAAFSAFIFSSPLFITPKYRSTVIMYPSATGTISKSLLTDRTNQKEDILDFGQDAQTEQMLQLLNSSRIRDKVVERFNLYDHYDIKPNHKYRRTKLIREYNANVTFRRTEYMAVKISVLDKDPQMAADIANYIAETVDSVRNEIQKDVAVPGFRIVEQQYNQLLAQIRIKEDSLSKLRELGVHEYESQSEMLNQQLAAEIARNNKPAIKLLEDKLAILAKYGGPYVSLKEELIHDKKQLSLLRTRYEEARVDAEKYLPFKFVVEPAVKAEKKAYPIRWLIMVITTVGALILGILFILLVENFREMYQVVAEQKKKVQVESLPLPAQEVRIPTPLPSLNEINTVMNNYFDNMNLVRIFLKWKWHLAVILAATAVIAIIISSPLVIRPKYKSSAVIYPANISPYSDESETEQLLQWLNSRDIMDSMIQRFDLARHYRISEDEKHFHAIMEYMYNKNVRISKTQFESVKIEVLDWDPVQARDMVNTVIELLNNKIRVIHREKYAEVVQSFQFMLDKKKAEIDSVLREHYTLRTQYDLWDYANQTREVARGFLRTVDGSSQNINTREVEKMKASIQEKGGDFIYYNTMIYNLLEHYGKIKQDYENAYYHLNKEFTYVNMVSHPFVADKKAYPVRWLIMVYALVAAALFSIIAIAIIENSKGVKLFSTPTPSE